MATPPLQAGPGPGPGPGPNATSILTPNAASPPNIDQQLFHAIDHITEGAEGSGVCGVLVSDTNGLPLACTGVFMHSGMLSGNGLSGVVQSIFDLAVKLSFDGEHPTLQFNTNQLQILISHNDGYTTSIARKLWYIYMYINHHFNSSSPAFVLFFVDRFLHEPIDPLQGNFFPFLSSPFLSFPFLSFILQFYLPCITHSHSFPTPNELSLPKITIMNWILRLNGWKRCLTDKTNDITKNSTCINNLVKPYYDKIITFYSLITVFFFICFD